MLGVVNLFAISLNYPIVAIIINGAILFYLTRTNVRNYLNP
jgi:hypothetical protein